MMGADDSNHCMLLGWNYEKRNILLEIGMMSKTLKFKISSAELCACLVQFQVYINTKIATICQLIVIYTLLPPLDKETWLY